MEPNKTSAPGYAPAPNQFPTGTAPPQYVAPATAPYGQQPPPVMGQQPPPTGVAPVMVPAAARPQNHLLMSVLACLFCFWPTGIVAIIHSLEVDKRYFRGDVQGAMESAQNAYKWAKITIIVGVVISCIYGVLVIISTVLRVSAASTTN